MCVAERLHGRMGDLHCYPFLKTTTTMKNEYENWSKEDLINEVKKLKNRWKYGLVWEDKPESIVEQCKVELPVFQETKKFEIISNKNKPTNLLIEGDNYAVLSALNYTHSGKIDVIYIDPPYNTGNKSWKYNNDYIEKDDSFKHSKWISFMYKRLKLAKALLKDDGIIITTIDDYEVFNLGHILNDVFGEDNRLGTVTIVHNPRGRSDDKYFATSHEYALFYAKNASRATIHKLALTEVQEGNFDLKDEVSPYRLLPLRRSGSNSTKTARPNLHYPLYYNKKTKLISVNKLTGPDIIEILPYDTSGVARVWRWGKATVAENIQEIVVKEVKGGVAVYAKDRIKGGRRPMTHWVDSKYDASSHGTMLLKKMFGEKTFDYPKSIYAVIDSLKISLGNKRDAIVLDFFAGSGTTGHALMVMNREDDGNRKFILCTNNESGIAEDVCYPRLRKAIKGFGDATDTKEGFNENLRYFKISSVNSSKTDKNKNKLTKNAVSMICVKENAFEDIENTDTIKVFRGQNKSVAILLDIDFLESFKKIIKKVEGPVSIYVFSLGNDLYEEEFEEFGDKVTVSPIPEAIYKIYKRIFQ